MNIPVGTQIGSWKITKKLVDTKRTLIAVVISKDIDGEWVLKINTNKKVDEAKIYDEYVKSCSTAVQIPEKIIYKRSFLNRLCGSIPYSEESSIDWQGVYNKLTGKKWYIMEMFDNDISLHLVLVKHNIKKFILDCITLIRHLHSQGLVHGDIKYKNILFKKSPIKFSICDYEFIRQPKKKRVEEKKRPIGYYYSYLGIPYHKPYFSYRADLTSLGYILWAALLSDRTYNLLFKWQEKASSFYEKTVIDDNTNYNTFKLIENMQNDEFKICPEFIKQYFQILERIDWNQVNPPDIAIYEAIIKLEHNEYNGDESKKEV